MLSNRAIFNRTSAESCLWKDLMSSTKPHWPRPCEPFLAKKQAVQLHNDATFGSSESFPNKYRAVDKPENPKQKEQSLESVGLTNLVLAAYLLL